MRAVRALLTASLLSASPLLAGGSGPARVIQTNLAIPTYLAAPPSPVPRFYEGRTYQGAKATFYPYPVQDVLTGVKTNQTYQALVLENPYLEICVLPELGGRIFSAMDKGNGYDFFYRQHVVKPALIGMLGAWISGGVEWNVPHHHRATSFMPVDWTTATNTDGSVTVWVGETELRHHLKWVVGVTLRPDRSYLELNCKVFNSTPFPHPMLFWINPAVHCGTNYQVIFPPGTEWAVQHGKPEFASWPIARQVYGGTDYTRGVDISWWKNHPSPVSFFAWNYEDDWFGGYDHGKQAGVVHWADHHVAPGKKFFEWGNGPEGEMWSNILSDEDGPYLELMAGAWSDNQPDYSWIQPGETREWQHWWYPVRELGGVKAATRDAAVNLEVTNGTAFVSVNATAEFPNSRIRLEDVAQSKTLFSRTRRLAPDQPCSDAIRLPEDLAPENLRLTVTASDGRTLAAYQPSKPKNSPMPKRVERPDPPRDYGSADELYFTGQRIEQLYSPSFEAAPYYEEILRRDPGDYRAGTALGILRCKQWRWDDAIGHLTNAVARATTHHIRPKDGEAFYYLGVAHRAKGEDDQAVDALQKALWSAAWRAAAGFALAELECARGNYPSALKHADLALEGSARNPEIRNLKASILRKLGRAAEAGQTAEATLAIDPLNVRAFSEKILAQRQREDPAWRDNVSRVRAMMGTNPEAFLDNCYSFANGGHWSEITEILRDQLRMAEAGRTRLTATEVYLLAYAFDQLGDEGRAMKMLDVAARMPPGFAFPSRYEEERVLRFAAERNARDALAPYLLGCLLYDNQPDEAVRAWEEARRRDGTMPLVHRNLGLAYLHHRKDIPAAVESLEKAIELNPGEPRLFYELDVLYEAGGVPVAKRLEVLTRHHETVAERDDALTREIRLLTVAGQAGRALELLKNRRFRNWEGSSQIHGVYVDACLAHGRELLASGRAADALRAFEAARDYPENLEVGRARRAARVAKIEYLVGMAHARAGESARAREAFERASARKEGGPSETQYYYTLALRKLGREEEAKTVFEGLVRAGERQRAEGEASDYFAKFGERESERVRKAEGHYLSGLGRLGLGEADLATKEFKTALELHPAHLGAVTQIKFKE